MKKLLLQQGRTLIVGLLAAISVAAIPAACLAVCGNSAVEAGEQCDDGNTNSGDCCSSTCQYEDSGSSCAADAYACSLDACDGAGTCVAGLLESNLQCAGAAGKLLIVSKGDHTKDKFALTLDSGPPTLVSELGDPVTSDRLVACIYDQNGFVMEAAVAPNGDCDGKPCWKATRSGFKFKMKDGNDDGTTGVDLKASDKDKTKLKWKGKGPALGAPSLAAVTSPLLAQVINIDTGRCFAAVFGDPDKMKLTAEKVVAKTKARLGLNPVRRAELDPDAPAPLDGDSVTRTSPDPSQVYVQSITYGGTGCPNGSVASSFSSDRKSFTLIFDSMVAASGPGIPATENRKNCQINLNIRLPQGFSYSIANLDYRGYVDLPKGVSAEQKSTYYFQGEVAQVNAGSRFTGPVAKDYLSRDPLGVVAWMPCGRVVPININTEVRLLGDLTKSAQITTDSIDGKVKHVLGIRWRAC